MRAGFALVLAIGLAACGGSAPAPVGPSAAIGPAPSSPGPVPSGAASATTTASASTTVPFEPPPPPPDSPPAFTVHVADVGTGLGVFIEGPDFALVYDAGSNDDLAVGDKNRFVAYLRATRPDLKKIDHVILSHPHRDHVELLPDVITGFDVASVWDSGAVNPTCGYRRFIDVISSSPGTTYHSGRNDQGSHKIDFGKVVCKLSASVNLKHGPKIIEGTPMKLGVKATMKFLHGDGVEHGTKFNDNSLVTLIELDGTKVLLMGDAEAGGRADPSKSPTPKSIEGHLLAKYSSEIDSDVLIVGHHGSKSSSRKAFIDAVSPKVSVISSGPTKYQTVELPDPEIVAELKTAGELLTTKIDDDACGKNPKKVGPDADGKPGGCDNVRIKIQSGKLTTSYAKISD